MNHLGDTNKMVSDTPRTDEAQFGTGRVSVSFARQLERELNAANQRIKRLETLGKELRECASMIGTHYSNQIETIDQAEAAVEAWDKFNKETKQ